jgi:hypothetical protein
MASRAAYAPDAVLIVPLTDPIRGSTAIRRYEESIRSAFPGSTIKVSYTVVRGGMTAVEWEFSGIHAGPITLRGDVVPATNRPLTLRGASFLRFTARGLIAEEHRYYDVWSVLEQLGVS